MQSAKLEVANLTYGRKAGPSPESLAQQYMPLVRKIAWHVHGRVSSAIEIEDPAADRHGRAGRGGEQLRGPRARLCRLCPDAGARRDDRSSAPSRDHLPLGHGAAQDRPGGTQDPGSRPAARRPKWKSRSISASMPQPIASWSTAPRRPSTRASTRSIPISPCGSPTSRSAPTTCSSANRSRSRLPAASRTCPSARRWCCSSISSRK